jgi:hypothetical protein
LISQAGASLFLSLGGVFFVFAYPVLYAWTGDARTTAHSAEIFAWYALANGLAGVLYLPFLLQFSHGNLRLHFFGNLVSISLLIPAMIMAAVYNGAVGVAIAYLIIRGAFLLLWTPVIHHRFAPGIEFAWLLKDILPAAIAVAVVVSLLDLLCQGVSGRLESFLLVATALVLSLGAALMAGGVTRTLLLHPWQRTARIRPVQK